LAARSDWDAFFDTDDANFSARSPFGKWIFVLRCWEIENYLLHPRVIEAFLADEQRRSVRDEAQVTEELFGILCDLIPVVAGSLVLTSYGLRRIDLGFGMGGPFFHIYDQIRQRLSTTASPEVAELLDTCIEQICSFGARYDDRSTAHWLDLIRGIDGKRVLRWLSHQYFRDRDVRFHLASLTRDRGLVDVMLDAFFAALIAA
jgi:hypothetical protein